MTTLAQTLEGSAIARSGCAVAVAVVLAAGLVSAGLHPREDTPSRPVTSTSIVVPRQAAATASPATLATMPTTTIPPAPTTTAPRKTPPFQVVPDDPSATVPPPVLGIDPISGD